MQRVKLSKNPMDKKEEVIKESGLDEEKKKLEEQNQLLTYQLQTQQSKEALKDQGEMNYQLLIVLEGIKKELNSISQQIYDNNRILLDREEKNEKD